MSKQTTCGNKQQVETKHIKRTRHTHTRTLMYTNTHTATHTATHTMWEPKEIQTPP